MPNISTFLNAAPQLGIYNQSNPGGTASATAVMMGLGAVTVLTPNKSGKVLVVISGNAASSLANDGITIDARYGTGTAPINGAAVTGTRFSQARTVTAVLANTDSYPFALNDIVSLTPGTAYWFDLSVLAITGGTASVTNLSYSLVEFPL